MVPAIPRSLVVRSRRLPLTLFLVAIAAALAIFVLGVQDLSGSPPAVLKDWREWTVDQWKYGTTPGMRCRGFDPDQPEEADPPDCLRARQYRQVKRVLDREVENKHHYWHFTHDHNLATLRKLLRCFLPSDHPEANRCPPKPLIINGWWYGAETVSGGTSGEVIWQQGVRHQVEMLGLHELLVGSYENFITTVEMLPDVYRSIWTEDTQAVSCITDPRCIAEYTPPIDSEDLSIGVPPEERGVIPLWALNIHNYWGCFPKEKGNHKHWWNVSGTGEWSWHSLGSQWIAIPWRLPGHVHLPYSIEDMCLSFPSTPWDEREEKALVFAKRSSYFGLGNVTPREHWTNLTKEEGFELISTANIEEGSPLPEGLVTIGKQSREDYGALVGSVKVLIGMGSPRISPSVWSALCQGTPVVIPYWGKDYNLTSWSTFLSPVQHGPAMLLPEPYVYSYYTKNYTDLVTQVRRAMTTRIERYIPPDMRIDFTLEETRKYVDRDQEAMFKDIVFKNGGKIPKMQQYMRERCIQLERCHKGFPPGRRPATPPGYVRKAYIESP